MILKKSTWVSVFEPDTAVKFKLSIFSLCVKYVTKHCLLYENYIRILMKLLRYIILFLERAPRVTSMHGNYDILGCKREIIHKVKRWSSIV